MHRHLLDSARTLTKASAAVRISLLPTLVGQARDAGLLINEELLRAAGYEPPSLYWEDALLARPTIRLDTFVHLLAIHAREPAEKQFDPRTPLAHVRIYAALKEWIAARLLSTFRLTALPTGRQTPSEKRMATDSAARNSFAEMFSWANRLPPKGDRYIKNPRAAVELLLVDAKRADLVPPSLKMAVHATDDPARTAEHAKPAPRAPGRATRETHKECLNDYFETEKGKLKPSKNRAWKFTQERLKERAHRPFMRGVYDELRPDLKKRGPRNSTSPPGK